MKTIVIKSNNELEFKFVTDLLQKLKLPSLSVSIKEGKIKSKELTCEHSHIPNEKTLKAMKEAVLGKGKKYKSAKGLFEALDDIVIDKYFIFAPEMVIQK